MNILTNANLRTISLVTNLTPEYDSKISLHVRKAPESSLQAY